MADIDPLIVFEKIKKKYLSFVLTTVCRNNEGLYNELNDIFMKNELLWRDAILHETPKYEKRNLSQIDMSFDKDFFNYLLTSDVKEPYLHQVEAWKKISNGKHCVIATGTGSGKTEGFLIPLIDYFIKNKYSGVQTIIIYPLKALANDQGKRIGKMLDDINKIFNINLKWGIFDGDTDKRKNSGYKSELTTKDEIIYNPPNILITNYTMLERILLNPEYLKILNNCKIKFIILDEIHYYRGAQGIDVSLLMRRLKFYLSKKQDIENMQYIGTSATLFDSNNENSNPNVENFLYKIFNVKIPSEFIVTPSYNGDYVNSILSKPTFLKDLSNEKPKKDVKVHGFFCSPNSLFRCLSCNKIHLTHKEICDNCNSKAIFEILTCRQCGNEYFNYIAEGVPKGDSKNDIAFINIDTERSLKYFNKSQDKDPFEVVLSSNKINDNSKKLNLCLGCLSLYAGDLESCENCNNSNFLEVYSVDDLNKSVVLNKDYNNKYCPACDFKETRLSLIVPISKLSDENCSHIIFDELFMALPDKRKKLLIFTDSVQRSSKFAREIEETHIKNIARAELHKFLEKIEKPVDLPTVLFQAIHQLRKKATIKEDIELQIKKELIEELLSKGKKVAALASRGLFKIEPENINQFNEKEKIMKTFEIFKENVQLLSYSDIITKEEIVSLHTFYDKKILIEKVYRIINDLKGKQLRNKDFSEAEEVIELLRDKGYINEFENKYFFKEEMINVVKTDIPISEKNYYDEWRKIENIPLIKSRTDTGKTNADERSKIEDDFKEGNKFVNFLVSTPTLELGIDIGDLDVIGLLYSPPSPAQYTQRIGRSGRKGTSSLAISYLSKRTLDSMYFLKPEDLVVGSINPPSFNINLEFPNKKALFSLFLHYVINCTDFTSHVRGKDWYKRSLWEYSFKEIKEKLIEYEGGFKDFVEPYIKSLNLSINVHDLINEWMTKLEEFIEIQKSIEAKDFSRQTDIFNFFQQAGLLPDYAFGNSGSLVSIYNREPITGYSLRDVCPPSTLDHDKSRFKCQRIDQNPKHQKKYTSSYKKCSQCCGVLSILGENKKCPICDGDFIDKDEEIIEPKIIIGKRSTFSLLQKKINWNYYIIDLPNQVSYRNIVSNSFICDIGMLFNNVNVSGEEKNSYKVCHKCGIIYDKKSDNTEKNCKHEPSNIKLGTIFKTKGIVLDLSSTKIEDFITFKNALIAAGTLESGCEDGEIKGIILENVSKIVLFDDVEGGVGFVDVFVDRLKDVLLRVKALCEETKCCENGCVKCIGSFWRQNELKNLNKRQIIPFINEIIKNLD